MNNQVIPCISTGICFVKHYNDQSLNLEMKQSKKYCRFGKTSKPTRIQTYNRFKSSKYQRLNVPQVVSTNIIQCSLCSETFSHQTQLFFHQEQAHADKLYFACSLCKQKFAAISLLSDHVSKHNIPSIFKCSKCSKSFTSPVRLLRHKCNEADIDNDRIIVNADTQQAVRTCSNQTNEHIQLSGPVIHTQYNVDCLNNLSNALEPELQSRPINHEPELQSIYSDNDIHSKLSNSSVAENSQGIKDDFKSTILTEAKLKVHDESNQQLDHYYILKDVNNLNSSVSSNDSDKTVSRCPDVQSHSAASSHCSVEIISLVKEKRSYTCSQCARSFTTQSSLTRHGRIHSDNNVRTFKCSHCDKTFLHKHHLTQHEPTHSGERQRTYKCAQCGRGFYHKQNLDRHELTHLGERFSCSICGKTFLGMRGLALHQLIHAAEQNYICTVCNRKFPRLSDLTAHSRRQHRNKEPIVCNKCVISFSKMSALRSHMKDVHDEERSWLCIHCGESYTRKECYKHRHIDALNEPERLACPECGKSFTLPLSLKTHMKVVHAESKQFYICASCDKKFATKSSLNAHKIIHSNAKEFACDQCDKTCSRRHDLNMHVQRKHSISSIPLLPCPQCDKMFSFTVYLEAHVKRMHTDDHPFLCPQCGNSYTTKTSLVNHLQVHDEAKHVCSQCGRKFRHSASFKYHINHVHGNVKSSFVCNVCNKLFTSRSSLNCHTLIHTGERRHVCEQCDKRFTKSYDLKIHVRRVHSNIRPYQCEQCEKKFATKGQLLVHRLLHCTVIQR